MFDHLSRAIAVIMTCAPTATIQGHSLACMALSRLTGRRGLSSSRTTPRYYFASKIGCQMITVPMRVIRRKLQVIQGPHGLVSVFGEARSSDESDNFVNQFSALRHLPTFDAMTRRYVTYTRILMANQIYGGSFSYCGTGFNAKSKVSQIDRLLLGPRTTTITQCPTDFDATLRLSGSGNTLSIHRSCNTSYTTNLGLVGSATTVPKDGNIRNLWELPACNAKLTGR